MISTVEKIYNVITSQFSNYKVIYENEDFKFVPLDEANADYQAIQEWIADGGTVIDNPPE
jgi:hypothetical protein